MLKKHQIWACGLALSALLVGCGNTSTPTSSSTGNGTPSGDISEPVTQAVTNSEAITLETVTLSAGDLVGFKEDGVYNFKGIPYATAERFQAPVPVTEYEGGMPYFGGVTMAHTGDMPFWFNSLDTVRYMVKGDEENAYRVAQEMADSLTAFATTGNPSISGLDWTPYTSDTHNTMVFDVNSACKTAYDEELLTLMLQGN